LGSPLSWYAKQVTAPVVGFEFWASEARRTLTGVSVTESVVLGMLVVVGASVEVSIEIVVLGMLVVVGASVEVSIEIVVVGVLVVVAALEVSGTALSSSVVESSVVESSVVESSIVESSVVESSVVESSVVESSVVESSVVESSVVESSGLESSGLESSGSESGIRRESSPARRVIWWLAATRLPWMSNRMWTESTVARRCPRTPFASGVMAALNATRPSTQRESVAAIRARLRGSGR
jgi:hypothetical protein